ncbi:MAG: hypothetical protein HC840_00420 [Leptolyngbyaceae cyanobacterium RM2_2_4]|nr:hypothetical protein [Leptolyngbyaceae cyanobacterium RM2_2_4]
MKQSIALAVGVGYRRKRQLESWGYKAVVVARDSETDDSWLNRAFVAGAKFAISADLDIPKLIEINKYPMVWINYPSNEPGMGELLTKYIDDSIKFKLRFFKDLTSVPSRAPVVSKKSFIKKFFEKYF